MTLRHRIRFYQQLALLVRAGVPIRGSLERLKARLSEKELIVVSEKVNAGERLGDAFAAAGFSAFECNLVVAGERSAHLDSVFEHLAEFWKRDLELRQALIRPLIYPLVVLNLVVLLMSLLEAVNSVPEPVIVVHLIMRFAVLYALIFVVYTLVQVSWSSPLMRRFWLRVPIIGGSLQAAYAYRWITVLKLEFNAGISLYRAVGDAWRASGYMDCERFAREGEQELRQGVDFSKLVLRWQQLPRDWIDFIETGQISGKFDEAFTQLEAEAARTWKLAQDRMTEWVPKICYFFVLLIVAAVVIHLMKTFYVDPIVNAENQIDNAGR